MLSDSIATFFNSQDLLFYGALEKCPVCNGSLEFDGRRYSCKGFYSEWASCTFSTRNPPRKEEPIKLPDSVQNSLVSDVIFSHLFFLFFSLYSIVFKSLLACFLRVCCSC